MTNSGTETSFMLAPGEKDVYGDKFMVTPFLPYLKGEMMCSSTRFVFKVPNTLFGIIPLGANENTLPLRNLAAVSTRTKFQTGRFVLGAILLIAGFMTMGSNPLMAIILMLLGVAFLAVCFPTEFVVTNPAGGSTYIQISAFEKKKLEAFKNELQNRIFADNDALRHNEMMNQNAMNAQQAAMFAQMQLQQQQMMNQTMQSMANQNVQNTQAVPQNPSQQPTTPMNPAQ